MGNFTRLDRKAGAASARRGCIRVVDHESRADQFLGKIDCRVGQKGQRDFINHNFFAAAFQHKVVLRRFVQGNFILKPAAAAAFDRDAQSFAICSGPDFGKAFKGR